MSLLLLARYDDWPEVIVAFFIVFAMTSITIRPILRLPAAAKGRFLGNILNVYHVNDFLISHPDLLVDSLWGASSSWALGHGTESQIGDVKSTSSDCCRRNQRDPVLD